MLSFVHVAQVLLNQMTSTSLRLLSNATLMFPLFGRLG